MPGTGAGRRLRSSDEKPPAVDVVSGDARGGGLGDEIEVARGRLRGRWELASVINFLIAFEPVIGDEVRMSAEEIETALIRGDDENARLHVGLLKGIPPVNKSLLTSEAWVTVLCKKVAPWWPWVAEGKIPLVASKGEEILQYKELDPEVRLLMLKALCEIRVDQDDILSFVNDTLKQKTEASSFRKEKIGVNSNGTSYWYEANSVLGYRLYKELYKYPKIRGKASLNPAGEHMQWETLATNLEEFRKVLDELSSSNIKADIEICRTVETDAIPALEKLQKKKERDLKKKERAQKLLNDVHSFQVGATRSCRNRKPVSYTFDEYDQMVDEAIGQMRKRKATEEKRREMHDEHEKQNTINSNEDSNVSSPTVEENTHHSEEDKEDEESYHHEDADNSSDNSDESQNKRDDSAAINGGFRDRNNRKPRPEDKTNRVAGAGVGHRDKSLARVRSQLSPGLKNRLRQRPVRNSAIYPELVPDSEAGSSSHYSSDAGQENTTIVADSDEENDS
ncbi:DDT domain-containing protein [Drosera capensis]